MFAKFKDSSRAASPAYFGVSMGLGGLAAAWAAAVAVFSLPPLVGHSLFLFTLTSLVLILGFYGMKLLCHPGLVSEDFRDIGLANFFPGVTISLLLLSSWLGSTSSFRAEALWMTSALAHILLALAILRRWVVDNVEITQANPSMFVPIAGMLVVPMTSPHGGSDPIAWFCFSVALLFWIALLPVMLNRILFHGQLPKQFLPTLFILIAPPALASLAIAHLQGDFGLVANGFFYIALFLGLLLATMAPTFFKLSFQMSWWAFTFPSAALASAAIARHSMAPDMLSASIALTLLSASTLIIGFVSWCTLRNLFSATKPPA